MSIVICRSPVYHAASWSVSLSLRYVSYWQLCVLLQMGNARVPIPVHRPSTSAVSYLQYTIYILDESMFVVVSCDTYHWICVSCISCSQCLILRARLLSLRTLCRLMRVENWYVCSIIHLFPSRFPFPHQANKDELIIMFIISQVSNVVVGVTTGKK